MKKTSMFLWILILAISLIFIGCQNSSSHGKLYNTDGTLHYEGDLKDGKPNGKGKAYINKILIYDGNFKDGATDMNGYTKTYWDNGKLMFDGYLKDEKRIEGFVYKEDGSLIGYLSYPPITIIGEWVGKNINPDDDIVYNVKFLENGTVTDNADKKLGTYNIEQETMKMNSKSKNYTIYGKMVFYSKNRFTISRNSQETILFIRKGTDGYNQ